MIYLVPEVASGLGEDTFWTWAHREFPNSSMGAPTSVTKDDAILRYSTKGHSDFPDHTISLMWELHPEMKAALHSNAWDGVIARIDQCQDSAKLTVTSELMLLYYAHYGKTLDVLPIGVNTDLFMPYDKQAMRQKYKLPLDRRIGFWAGTTHAMKGFDKLQQYAAQNPDVYWVIVWKSREESAPMFGASNFIFVPQQQLAELMSCADFFLSCGRLRPFFMVEWEAMACNLPMVILDDMQKDFVPSASPRDDIFKRGWDRHTTKQTWLNYIANFIANR